MVRNMITILIVAAVGLAFIAGCQNDAQTGALIGTAIGAGVGQAIGGDTEATLIGAGVGAAGGYLIGNEQDKKKSTAQTRQDIDTVMVNVTNSNGSVIQVPIKKQGVGYVGPRGEYYDHLPTSEELKPVYGF